MMNDHAFLFPGQGAQSVGMGAELVESSARARAVFDRGKEILGWDVLEVCLNGPSEELNSTRVSQPAIFLLSMAVLEAIDEHYGGGSTCGNSFPAAATAGLSLGEYSALVFAGSIDFADGVKTVGARGQFMQEACDESPGGMVALRLAVDKVEKIVETAKSAGRIGIANYNSVKQTVISGDQSALDVATELAKEAGCRRPIPLKVAGAYHSPLMASATEKLAGILETLEIKSPRCPFYSNVTGGTVEDPDEIRRGLLQQVESSVRWSSILEKLVAETPAAYEVGTGTVLRGLAKNVDPDYTVHSVCDVGAVVEL